MENNNLSLEEYLAQLNANIFLKEFSFAKNEFRPSPRREVEFADHVIWLDDLLILFQLKERGSIGQPTEESEKNWFEKKVLKKATKQIRDTLNYLNEHNEIHIRNQRGYVFNISTQAKNRLIKVVVHAPTDKLPEKYLYKKHYFSSSDAGFIHILPIVGYLNVCRTLFTPGEIVEYFNFRQNLLLKWPEQSEKLPESALLGQYLYHDTSDICPIEENIKYFITFQNKLDEFDISAVLQNFAEHIEYRHSQNVEHDYYNILMEFAKLNRGDLKEAKLRIKLCMESCASDESDLPYRMVVPRTECGFVFIPIPKDGVDFRINALENLTYAAKYDQKLKRCIGVSFAKEGEYFLIDWCFLDSLWQYDEEMEQRLKENFPFRKVNEKYMPRYTFDRL